MADVAENQPFLTESYRDDPQNKQDDEEDYLIRVLPASAHFKRTLKLLIVVIAFLSFSMLALLITSYVLIHSDTEFQQTWNSLDVTRNLSIVLFTMVIIATLNIFFAIPTFLNLLIHPTMSIVVLVYACRVLFVGWPNRYFCGKWDFEHFVPEKGKAPAWNKGSASCNQSMNIVKILMGVAGGISIIIGLLLVTTTILQVVAFARANFRRGTNLNRYGFREGFKVQFTLTVIPPVTQNESRKIVDAEVTEGAEVTTGVDQSESLIGT